MSSILPQFNITELDRQLAAQKRRYFEAEAAGDTAAMADANAQGNMLRAAGARETVANYLTPQTQGNIFGKGMSNAGYMPTDFSWTGEFQGAIDEYGAQRQSLAAAPMPEFKPYQLSEDAQALLAQIKANVANLPTADDIMNSRQFQQLTDAVASRRADAERQARAELAARGVLGSNSTPAASRISWVYADAARKEQELIPALLQAETARQQANYANLINAFNAQMGAEGQMFSQGLQQFNATVPYSSLTAAQRAELDAAERDSQEKYAQWRAQQTGVLPDGTPTLGGREMNLAENQFSFDKAVAAAKAAAGVSGSGGDITDMTTAQLNTYRNSLNQSLATLLDAIQLYSDDKDSKEYKAAQEEYQKYIKAIEVVTGELNRRWGILNGGDDNDGGINTPTPRTTARGEGGPDVIFSSTPKLGD